jgi:hypothetical protein
MSLEEDYLMREIGKLRRRVEVLEKEADVRWGCEDCHTVYSVDAPECPECGSTNHTDDQDKIDSWHGQTLSKEGEDEKTSEQGTVAENRREPDVKSDVGAGSKTQQGAVSTKSTSVTGSPKSK